jgi:hypothetical protein
MKQKDIGLILVVIILSAAMSLIISKLTFGRPQARQEKVEVVEAIDSNFGPPNKKYFNNDSINPTVLIEIDSGTENPIR